MRASKVTRATSSTLKCGSGSAGWRRRSVHFLTKLIERQAFSADVGRCSFQILHRHNSTRRRLSEGIHNHTNNSNNRTQAHPSQVSCNRTDSCRLSTGCVCCNTRISGDRCLLRGTPKALSEPDIERSPMVGRAAVEGRCCSPLAALLCSLVRGAAVGSDDDVVVVVFGAGLVVGRNPASTRGSVGQTFLLRRR